MSTIDGPLGAGTSGSALGLSSPARAGVIRVSDRTIGRLGLAAVLFGGILLSLAAADTNNLLPETIQPVTLLGALAGPLQHFSFHLTSGELIATLVLMFAGYVTAVQYAKYLSSRTVIVAIGVFVTAVLLAPPLFSTDLFSYQEYARMFFGLHANPYTNNSQVLLLDNLHPFVPAHWLTTPSVYGPLFTLLSGFFQNTGPLNSTTDIALSAYFYKTVAALSCFAIVWLLWKSAKLRGVEPVRAAAMFGLNPLIVLYGVGGGHNDLLMMVFATTGIWALLTRRERSSGALAVTAAAIKLTGMIFLPFALVAPPQDEARHGWRRVAIGAAVALVITAGVGLAVFGTSMTNMVNTLSEVQSMGGWQSVPGFFASVLSWETVSHIVSLVFGICFSLICLRLLWRIHRGELDWLEGAGWATFWLLVATSQIVPWYISWLVVPMALCTSRRLWLATTCFSAWLLLTTMMTYLPHAYSINHL